MIRIRIPVGLLLNPETPLFVMGNLAFTLFMLILFLSISCSSGALVGFSYHARGSTRTSSLAGTMSFLEQNKVSPSQIRVFAEDHKVLASLSHSGVSVDLYLNQSHFQNLLKSKPSAIYWLKTHVITLLPSVNIKSIVALSCLAHERQSELPRVLSTLKSLHSILSSFGVDNQVKVSVAFPLSFFKNLSRAHERDLSRIFCFLKKVRSYVIVEAKIDEESKMEDGFVQSMTKSSKLAISILASNDVPLVLTIKSSAVPTATEVVEFTNKASKALENNAQISNRLVGLYTEMAFSDDFEQKELKREEEQIFPSFHRELLDKFHLQKTMHDTFPPTTDFPSTPIINPSNNPTPTVVTVPSTNPVTITPANPYNQVPVPLTTPVTVPSTYPSNTPAPVSNPATTPITVPGAQPITNPVTTYPAPTGVPTTTPVTNPVSPPATSNSPAVSGQSWCVAKSGVPETSLQSALDYACGGGADCSQIQQSGSCYNPNTLQNHASYAFNSYYQKNPLPTSCDFGGSATLVNSNPSTGSCIFPSSSSPSSSSPPSTPTPSAPTLSTPTPSITPPSTPTITNPAAGTPPPSWAGVSGSGSPPTVLNSSSPASTGTMPDQFGSDIPPSFNSSTSRAAGLRPFIGCIVLVTSFVTKRIVLNM